MTHFDSPSQNRKEGIGLGLQAVVRLRYASVLRVCCAGERKRGEDPQHGNEEIARGILMASFLLLASKKEGKKEARWDKELKPRPLYTILYSPR